MHIKKKSDQDPYVKHSDPKHQDNLQNNFYLSAILRSQILSDPDPCIICYNWYAKVHETVRRRYLTWYEALKTCQSSSCCKNYVKIIQLYYRFLKFAHFFTRIRIGTSQSDVDPIKNRSDPQHCQLVGYYDAYQQRRYRIPILAEPDFFAGAG